jgi:hypothetical protein
MKLLTMHFFFQPRYYSIPFQSEYSPQHPVLKHPQFIFLPSLPLCFDSPTDVGFFYTYHIRHGMNILHLLYVVERLQQVRGR